MFPPPLKPVTIARWALLLVLCGGGALAPRSVLASCGDYLQGPHHPPPAPFPGAPVPLCRGPHCRSSLPPVKSNQPVTTVRLLEQGVWVERTSTLPLRPVPAHVEVADATPVKAPGSRIERPPRSSNAGRNR